MGKELERFESLSKREKEIIDLLLDGLTNKEIAKKLYLTEGTVKSYIHNILTKLNLKNRLEIIIKFRNKD